MPDVTGLSPADARLETIRRAVAAAEKAESDLQDAVDAAREAGDPEDAIRRVLATRDSAARTAAHELVAALGPTYVAAVAGATSKQQAAEWAEPGGSVPGPDAARRLRLAHRTWTQVAGARGDAAARAWFLGANPHLGGDSPLVAIKRDRAPEVRSAIDALLDER
ncbi:hypothetical protein ACGIF2_02365 [Cellulomonas sp. P22]|uniref:hypothetical protein n=1 Tax=Cellulomonas sp. P22 TaxID=3373189 RepID=UPI0037948DE7